MTEAEKIVTKVSRDLQQLIQLVKGNGTIKGSVLGRLEDIESWLVSIKNRLEIVENYPCKDGCLYEKKEQEADDMEARKRTFRIGDLANYIQLVFLALIIYGMFFQ